MQSFRQSFFLTETTVVWFVYASYLQYAEYLIFQQCFSLHTEGLTETPHPSFDGDLDISRRDG